MARLVLINSVAIYSAVGYVAHKPTHSFVTKDKNHLTELALSAH